ncbi:MAG: 5-methyltetrahydrofolate--homocysteine methyltransferase [Prevotellaceae bacterium]|nr:5-methyltetrahydrofolate--homocysteine methyltransferase [Prevotellaceae bacterium]
MTYTPCFTIPELKPFISWSYFFHAWSLGTSFASIAQVHDCPACLAGWMQNFPEDQKTQAQTALNLWHDAQEQLRRWSEEGRSASCRVMIERAWSEEEDIVLPDLGARLPLLRSQHYAPGEPALCLADFVAPRQSGINDHIGLFASTTEPDMEQSHDDDPYRHLLAQTLADRLAEAAAELAHMMVRRQWWGYAADEQLTIPQMLAAHYQGIRPAVGYPSLPDQSLNFLLSTLLDFPSLGIRLTESGAMMPHASTSGIMLAHPCARYFSVGTIGEDQLRDYARRRGMEPDALRPFIHTEGF